MHRIPIRLAGIVLAAALVCPTAFADVVAVSPVNVQTLSHVHNHPGAYYRVVDGITIPGAGYASDPFVATIETGDEIRIRVQAPPGKKFVVYRNPAAVQTKIYTYLAWHTGVSDATSDTPTHHAQFENSVGGLPTEVYAFTGVGNGG